MGGEVMIYVGKCMDHENADFPPRIGKGGNKPLTPGDEMVTLAWEC